MLSLLFNFIVSQTYEDVVILKNGSEIHGIIIEQKPNEYIKIQSGRNIFVYQMDEIELIKKEVVDKDNKVMKEWPSSIFLKSHLFSIDSDLSKHYSPSYTLGLQYMINNKIQLNFNYLISSGHKNSYMENYNDWDVGVNYHVNKDSFSLKFGCKINTVSFDYTYSYFNYSNTPSYTSTDTFTDTFTDLILGFYNNNLFWLTMNKNIQNEHSLIKDSVQIELGKLWVINSKILGLSLLGNSDSLEYAWVTATMGHSF